MSEGRDNHAPVEAVEGVSEEQSHKAVCPGVGSKHVKNAEFWTTEPDSSQELKLEVGFAVELALYVVFQDQLSELGELASFGLNVSK